MFAVRAAVALSTCPPSPTASSTLPVHRVLAMLEVQLVLWFV